jgi:hypothetical protein
MRCLQASAESSITACCQCQPRFLKTNPVVDLITHALVNPSSIGRVYYSE